MNFSILKFTLIFFILYFKFECQSQINLSWATGLNSSNSEISEEMIMDNNGNIYVTGGFTGTLDFDPSSATYNLTSNTSTHSDAFLAKYDSNSNILWATSFGGNLNDKGYRVQFDVYGNIVIGGTFFNTVDFDPSSSVYNLTSAGSGDIFFSRFNTSGGFINAFRLGGRNTTFNIDNVYNFRIDFNNRIYATGSFSDTMDFDPGSGTAIQNALSSSSLWVGKYSITGTHYWSFAVIGSSTSANVAGYDIELDGIGNFYLTGSLNSTFDFNPSSGTNNFTSNGGLDLFLAKYDTSGNYVWCYSAGGSSSTSPDLGQSLQIDNNGDIYLTGNIGNNVDFDFTSGTSILTLKGVVDGYIAKFNSSGGLIWANNFGNSSVNVLPFKILINNNYIYMVGWFNGSMDFDPSSSTANLTPIGSIDGMVAKYDLLGNYQTAFNLGSTNIDIVRSIAIFQNNIYCTGVFNNATIDMDPSSSSFNLSNSGSFDIFLAKYNNLSLLNLTQITMNVFCQDTEQKLTIEFETNPLITSYEIEQSIDGADYKTIQVFKNDLKQITFQVTNLNNYFYRLKTIDINGKIEYSYPNYIDCNQKTTVLLFPNSIQNEINLKIQTNKNSKVKSIEIYNNIGQLIIKENDEKKISDNETIIIDFKSNLPGIYFLKIILSNGEEFFKSFRKE